MCRFLLLVLVSIDCLIGVFLLRFGWAQTEQIGDNSIDESVTFGRSNSMVMGGMINAFVAGDSRWTPWLLVEEGEKVWRWS